MVIQVGDAPVYEPGYGCLWPVDEDCLPDVWESVSPAVQHRSIAFASATLRRLTGFRVGGCPITVRPCSRAYVHNLNPARWEQGWWPMCGCGDTCGCGDWSKEVRLAVPVGKVYSVKVDGVVLNPSTYMVSDNILVNLSAAWPTTQNLDLPDTAVGTFSVTYLNAYEVDALGAYAAGVLAAEFAKACAGQKCRLPSSVTSVSRQGVNFEIASGVFDKTTGIREVDAYIANWNPDGLREDSKVWTPGRRRGR